jgi:hypothetical protein
MIGMPHLVVSVSGLHTCANERKSAFDRSRAIRCQARDGGPSPSFSVNSVAGPAQIASVPAVAALYLPATTGQFTTFHHAAR